MAAKELGGTNDGDRMTTHRLPDDVSDEASPNHRIMASRFAMSDMCAIARFLKANMLTSLATAEGVG
jgi:hypothetical protein